VSWWFAAGGLAASGVLTAAGVAGWCALHLIRLQAGTIARLKARLVAWNEAEARRQAAEAAGPPRAGREQPANTHAPLERNL